MGKKLWAVLLVMVLMMPVLGQAAKVAMEETLSMLDEYKHSSDQFQKILVAVQENHPKYTSDKIGDLILKSYYEVRDAKPNVGLFEVAEGVRRFSVDKIGLDLKDLVVAYIDSQTK